MIARTCSWQPGIASSSNWTSFPVGLGAKTRRFLRSRLVRGRSCCATFHQARNSHNPFDEDPTPPPFPLDRLPAVIRDLARLVSDRAAVDETLPALIALGAVAALAQKTARVRGVNWEEQLSLFVLVLANVSDRKSPVFAAALEPLQAVEAQLEEDTTADRLAHNEHRRQVEGQLAEARKAAVKPAKGKGQPSPSNVAQLAQELEALSPERERPRLRVDDVTVERMKDLMGKKAAVWRSVSGTVVPVHPQRCLFADRDR